MMRFLPKSIAGRTTMVLCAGLLLILAASAAIFSLSEFGDGGPRRNARLLMRIVTLASIVNGMPADPRPGRWSRTIRALPTSTSPASSVARLGKTQTPWRPSWRAS